jgi:hypothetical protein
MIRRLSLTFAALAALGAAAVCLCLPGTSDTGSLELTARSGYTVASS